MKYRAKSYGYDKANGYITHTYGVFSGKPLEDTTMEGLAYAIAYLYHRHAIYLYESNDGVHFKKSDEKTQMEFSHIMDDEFKDHERH